MKRRKFISKIPLLSAAAVVGNDIFTNAVQDAYHHLSSISDLENEPDKGYWSKVRQAFPDTGDHINFNSAGLGTPTMDTFSAFLSTVKDLQHLPPRSMTSLMRKLPKELKRSLSELTGVKTTELAIVRNATEALANAIYGIPLKKGDEVIIGNYDYPHIYYAWQQRAKRDGIVLRYADFPVTPSDPQEVIDAYLNKVNRKTRAIQLTDIVNYTGMQTPTRSILQQLPSHVRYRIVDAAQSLGNTRDDWQTLGATHIGASLHKWIGAPAGMGVLFVATDFIKETWPMFATNKMDDPTAIKFEHIGTRDAALYPATILALDFHRTMGLARKKKRLEQLTSHFCEKAEQINGLTILSPEHVALRSNIILFSCSWNDRPAMASRLWLKNKILTTGSDWKDAVGIRISINIFNTKEEIEALNYAIMNSKTP